MTAYWYCLKHTRVETVDDACRATDRLGPYESRGEAERALQIAADRTEAWDNDPDWNDDVAPGDEGE
jgi:hypothetical protein